MKIVACSGVMRMMQRYRGIKCMRCKSKYFISYLQEFHKVFFCGSPACHVLYLSSASLHIKKTSFNRCGLSEFLTKFAEIYLFLS